MSLLIIHIVWPLLAYLAGSIPFGLIIVRWSSRADIRSQGSGNIGATNVRRIAGSGWAAVTLAGDLLKGLLPTLSALILVGDRSEWLAALTAFAAIAGHIYPVYLKFKPSGKGVATTFGAFLPLAPWAAFVALSAFLLAVYKLRRASAGSLAAALTLPVAVWFTSHAPTLTLCALIAMALIIYRHEDNLRRLAKGEEPSLDADNP